jgi:hypothetical protein
MDVLSFPLRIQPNGLLKRTDPVTSLLQLIHAMARTPLGSWAACPEFGLRDLLEDGKQKSDIPRLALDRINMALAVLELHQYQVVSFKKEKSTERGMDIYSVVIVQAGSKEKIRAQLRAESRES